SLAPSDQLVEIEGEGRSRAIFVNSDLQTLPTVTIATRERRVLDFYYPLPENIADAEDLPTFNFLWQVSTGARVVGSMTSFQRLDREPPNVRVVYHSGWGPYWWYDPMFDRAVFIHYRPIGFYRPGHVRVTRPPSWHYRPVRDHRR
ncbi:MAG TPA: hypothetical protein VLB44_24180, partial [Kofleriaceae bacterium]|nr:hypothetical protein [Kofleriaceae bacterium]